MKHYFLVAKDVGDLTTILCSALEIEQVKSSPGLGAAAQSAELADAAPHPRDRRFPHRQRPAQRRRRRGVQARSRQPHPLLRQAEQTGAFFHPNAVRLLRRSLRLIDDKLRNDPEANRIFLDMLCSDKNPEPTLRRMNEAGVLGRFVPEFGQRRVDDAVQHVPPLHGGRAPDPHRRHALRHRARRGCRDRIRCRPQIFKTIQNRRALYVAAFLHDIAKGRAEDHSLIGVGIARELCPRFGMTRGRDRNGRLAGRAPSADEPSRSAATSATRRPSATSPTSCKAPNA